MEKLRLTRYGEVVVKRIIRSARDVKQIKRLAEQEGVKGNEKAQAAVRTMLKGLDLYADLATGVLNNNANLDTILPISSSDRHHLFQRNLAGVMHGQVTADVLEKIAKGFLNDVVSSAKSDNYGFFESLDKAQRGKFTSATSAGRGTTSKGS